MTHDIISRDIKSTKLAFALFVVYIISFFLRIPARVSILGDIRLDLLLVACIFVLIIGAKLQKPDEQRIAKYLKIMFIYSILVLPFVTWPGSVLSKGLPEFVKAVIFFFFTYSLVLNEKRLKIVVYTFLLANTFRIAEPLYLNITQDYWGSVTTFGWDSVDRLAGSPYDVINANGLAFLIATVLPFYHYLFGNDGFWRKLIYWSLLPILLYTMSLTLSRSGILAVAIIYGVIFLKSNKKFILSVIGIFGIAIFFASLNPVQQDRYLSIFDEDTKSAQSAEGRLTGLKRDFQVGMAKPIFGHGLGTSREANWNIGGRDQISHNLWLQIFQELGIVGLIIFILYAKEIYKGFLVTNRSVNSDPNASSFLQKCLPAMQVWLVMNFLFSFASYGLSSYEWYLFGGFSAVLTRLSWGNYRQKLKSQVSTGSRSPREGSRNVST
ncbi:O-antigen ligase family protein [Marinimicrobium sp. C2-29]|uniref:O-antigen ligase family protein n=1 Tax=Marinimicrobium sp. C2-29 TaxID=3139825 RepID=UPI00313A39F8